MVLGKFGKGGNRATTEKVSDGVRSMFKKFTGVFVSLPYLSRSVTDASTL